MKRFPLVIAAISMAGIVAFTVLREWNITPDFTIAFSSKDVNGRFNKFSGKINFEEKHPETSSFILKLDVNSITTDDSIQTIHVRSDDYFDAAKYPFVLFTSSKIEKGDSTYSVTGTMEMKGIKKAMTIPFTFTSENNKGTFRSSFTVRRSDFNIGDPDPQTADELSVDVTVAVE